MQTQVAPQKFLARENCNSNVRRKVECPPGSNDEKSNPRFSRNALSQATSMLNRWNEQITPMLPGTSNGVGNQGPRIKSFTDSIRSRNNSPLNTCPMQFPVE